MASVLHPHVSSDEFEMLQENAGWILDMELLAGEAVLVPPIGDRASSTQGELYLALRRWQETVDDGGLLLQDVFVKLQGANRPAPDIAWWSAKRLPPEPHTLGWGMRKGVPDLVVEVLSPSTRANDLGFKRDMYMRYGVRELWLVDPDARTVIRVRPGVSTDEALIEGQTLRSELLAGFALEIARIFPFPRD
jgi:Uma2 family endonuclease